MKTPDPPYDPMTVREAAARLGITYQQLMSRVYRGKIRAKKRGHHWYISVADVDAHARRVA